MPELPIPPTPFIGRQHQRRVLYNLLSRDNVRLITLTGPGGSGKTRLGLHVAAALSDAFSDGITFVDLAPISDPAQVIPTLARALGLDAPPGRTHFEVVSDYLHGTRRLLFLDNFERVIAAAIHVGDLLHACDGLSVVVTSRTPLPIRGEHEFRYPRCPCLIRRVKRRQRWHRSSTP